MMKSHKNSAKDILKRISLASKDQIFQVIRSEWESRDPKIWSRSNKLYLCAGKKMMELGQTFLGFDILKERYDFLKKKYDLLKKRKEFIADNVTLIQQWALALARLGATGKAQKELMELYNQGNKEPDTIGILARTYKDLWMKTRSPLKKRKFLESARDFYLEGYNVNKDYYNGINAASLSLFLGEKNKTKKIASKVIDICHTKRPKDSSNKYWLLATLGEAFLISGDYEKATIYYKKAFDYGIGKGEYGNLASTKQQAHLILKYLGFQKHSRNNRFNELKQVINLGNIVYCIGHMIDRHGREQQRFPASLENQVRVEIQKALEKLNAKTGYCSAANGTDILFIEEMLKRKAEVNVHLPFKEDDFIDASVGFAGEKWVTRFKKVLEKASSVIKPVDEAYLGDQCLFDYGNRMIIGKTMLHAETLSLTPHLLAVWDGKPGDSRGGTADTIKSWKKWGGKNITIIDISKLSPPKEKSVSTARSVKPFAEISPKKNFGSLSREIKSMLFADVVGFSKLQDDQIPYYIYQFMGAVGKLITGGKYIPIFNNTWGDGLFFVFNSVYDAACFALELRDLVLKTDWKKKGLPPETNIRIALHSGPVYSGFDPLLGKLNYYGAHVSRSARLEPVTMPGSVYASESFAALLKVDGVTDPVCEYLGQLPLAKDYGVYSVYHIRRGNEIE